MTFVKHLPGFVGGLALAGVLFFAPGEARAVDECGALNSGNMFTRTCSTATYGMGIAYSNAAYPVTLTVTGGAATTVTVTAPSARSWPVYGAIGVTTASGTGSRAIDLTVGSGSDRVVILRHASSVSTDANQGVVAIQQGTGADKTTVRLGSGVTIGTMDDPMRKFGVWLLSTANANTGTQAVTSAATIHSTEYGIILDNRGEGDSEITNTGTITTSAMGGSANDKSGIRIIDWSGSFGVGRTADTTTTVTNSGSGSVTVSAENAHGIHVDAEGRGLYSVDHRGTISTAGAAGHGIYVDANRHAGVSGPAVTVESSGVITTSGAGGHGINVINTREVSETRNGDLSVTTTGGRIAVSGADSRGIHVASSTNGGIAVDNAAAIEAGADGIHVYRHSSSSGATGIVNRGAIETKQYGIVVWHGGASDVRIENSGDITPASGAGEGRAGIFVDGGAAGDIVIENEDADITGTEHGIFARNTEGGGGVVTVVHDGGEVHGRRGSGIFAALGRWRNEDAADSPDHNSTATVRVEVKGGTVKASETLSRVAVVAENNEGGSIEVVVSKGATLTALHNAGIFAYMSDRQNTAGRIVIAQDGAITAAKGVYASVSRASAAGGESRATDEPLIDVEWSGTFTESAPTGTAGRNSVAHAIETAQEAAAGPVLRGAAHDAGIDAEVMSWRNLNRIATRGDDPGALADVEAQEALVGADATDAARKAAIIARFREVLTDETLGDIPGADDIDTDDTAGLSEAEIVAYLTQGSDARRTLLRDVLARSLSDQEQAVLEALAENDGLDAALDGVTGATDAWKEQVKALANRFNVGDIRVAMTGGSITSSGDGIRAWYAAAHDDNGRIDVTVAEGASVTGGQAGIYVANAGKGLRIARKYTPAYVMGDQEDGEELADGEEIVTLDEYLNQVVRVDGTVTGGADAAVHLVGGGALIVGRTGRLVAGAGQPAILVNDPGPAVVFVYGQATGSEGAAAAVELTGGGIVTVGLTGMVVAGGATNAVQYDRQTPVQVVLRAERGQAARFTQESVGAALARIDGVIRPAPADGAEEPAPVAPTVFLVEAVPVNGGERTTGYVLEALKTEVDPDDGSVTIPLDHLPTESFRCALAQDGRCRLYEALPAALLAMNALPTAAERLSAARDGRGGWARIEAASGKWTAASATQATATAKLALDHSRFGVRAGADVAALGEDSRLGVSAHGLRGSAKTADRVKAKMSGIGLGVYATAGQEGGVQLDFQAATTWYDVDVETPDASKDDAKGRGHAASLELGRRMALSESMTVTPRAGLSWSDAGLGRFAEVTRTDAGAGAAGAAVSVEDASSLTGRVGVSVASAASDGARLFGSLDVAHEFSGKREAAVSGTALKATAKKTSVVVGLGGLFDLGEGASLSGSATYALGSAGNSEFGGGLSLDVQF